MNSVNLKAQHLFQQELDASERSTLDNIIGNSKQSSAITQQLAVDASKLVTLSAERLAEQSSAGFFKRMVGVISGQTSRNDLKNQADLMHMQKIAWHYLQELQQQNLMTAQSIAIVRNNLGSLADYTIETRQFLEQAIDKFDSRIKSVEKDANFNRWSKNVEANRRRFRSQPEMIRIVYLTYDFINTHRETIVYGCDLNSLLVTLQRLDIDCDGDIQLIDFISQIIYEIESIGGVARYRDLIKIYFEEINLDSQFIQKNISGVAFNSLYYLSDNYEKISEILSDAELCDSDEKRASLISKLFGEEFSGLSISYSIRDLISEISSGIILSVDIYKDLNGLNLSVETDEIQQYESVTLLQNSLPDITKHTFLGGTACIEDKCTYITLLKISFNEVTDISDTGKSFLSLLADIAKCDGVMNEVSFNADNNKNNSDDTQLKNMLNSDDLIYTWLLDSMYLVNLCGIEIKNSRIPKLTNILNPLNIKKNFGHLINLIKEEEKPVVMKSIRQLLPQTKCWKNAIHYRALSFSEYFSDIQINILQVQQSLFEVTRSQFDLSMKASNYSFYMNLSDFNDGFFIRITSSVAEKACTLGRRSATSNLNDLCKKVRSLLTDIDNIIYQANNIFVSWDISPVDVEKSKISPTGYELNNSALNEDWHNQFGYCENAIQTSLDNYSSALYRITDQIEKFASGEFDQCVSSEIAERKDLEKREREIEKNSKKSVNLELDGVQHSVSISWKTVESFPCHPESIQEIITNGSKWLALDGDNKLYLSPDGEKWEEVAQDLTGRDAYSLRLKYICGFWFGFSEHGNYSIYSEDGFSWFKIDHPKDIEIGDLTITNNLFKFRGAWIWRLTYRNKYSYGEKGVLFNSEQESNYEKSVLFFCDSLIGAWRKWENSFNFQDGVSTELLYFSEKHDILISFNNYDSHYLEMTKKIDCHSFISYYKDNRGWRQATWSSGDETLRSLLISEINDQLFLFYSGKCIVSDQGYQWKNSDLEINAFDVSDCFDFKIIQAYDYRENKIIFTQDGKTLSEMLIHDGRWSVIKANQYEIIGVLSPNSHESLLMIGEFLYDPPISFYRSI